MKAADPICTESIVNTTTNIDFPLKSESDIILIDSEMQRNDHADYVSELLKSNLHYNMVV